MMSWRFASILRFRRLRRALLIYTWPGNVRELRQKIMGAVLQAQEGVVTKEHLELAVTKLTSPVSFALRNDAEDKERILRALKDKRQPECRRRTAWNKQNNSIWQT